MQHSDREPRVVLMCGISGSGKTYHSRKLQEKGYERLSLDEYIWSVYGPDFAGFPAERRRCIFMEAAAELDRRLAELIDRGVPVVVDSTMCKRAKRDKTRQLCREHGVLPLLVWLDTPLELLRERLSRRKGSGPNDQIVSPEELSSFYAGFEIPESDEEWISPDELPFTNP